MSIRLRWLFFLLWLKERLGLIPDEVKRMEDALWRVARELAEDPGEVEEIYRFLKDVVAVYQRECPSMSVEDALLWAESEYLAHLESIHLAELRD